MGYRISSEVYAMKAASSAIKGFFGTSASTSAPDEFEMGKLLGAMDSLVRELLQGDAGIHSYSMEPEATPKATQWSGLISACQKNAVDLQKQLSNERELAQQRKAEIDHQVRCLREAREILCEERAQRLRIEEEQKETQKICCEERARRLRIE